MNRSAWFLWAEVIHLVFVRLGGVPDYLLTHGIIWLSLAANANSTVTVASLANADKQPELAFSLQQGRLLFFYYYFFLSFHSR